MGFVREREDTDAGNGKLSGRAGARPRSASSTDSEHSAGRHDPRRQSRKDLPVWGTSRCLTAQTTECRPTFDVNASFNLLTLQATAPKRTNDLGASFEKPLYFWPERVVNFAFHIDCPDNRSLIVDDRSEEHTSELQ